MKKKKNLTLSPPLLQARGAEASWYGTSVRKDIYVYGLLDRTPLTFDPSWVTAGFNWSLNGFLLANVLERVGGERAKELFGVVGKGLMTHFETHFSKEISLEEVFFFCFIIFFFFFFFHFPPFFSFYSSNQLFVLLDARSC